MPLSEKYNCLFVHIPRTGGTSLSAILEPPVSASSLNGVCEVKIGEEHSYQLVLQFQHLTPIQILYLGTMDEVTLGSYFRFCFVRNPWDRALSDYSNWYHKCSADFREYIHKLRRIVNYVNENYTHDVTSSFYQEYTDLVFSVFGGERWVDPHFFPQYLYVYDNAGQCIIDFVGRFESCQEDANKILQKLKIDKEIPRMNSSKHLPYVEMYDQEPKEIIEEIYQKDIEIFNYQF